MYNGAVDEDSISNDSPPSPDLQRPSQDVKKDNFKEIQLRFLTFEEKNKRKIIADKIKQQNARKDKSILKWMPCLECCR